MNTIEKKKIKFNHLNINFIPLNIFKQSQTQFYKIHLKSTEFVKLKVLTFFLVNYID